MIAFVKGKVIQKIENSVYLETAGGLAFEVFVTSRTLDTLTSGEEALLYTHLQVKEDGLALFGFLSREELRVFRLLIGVSGIGPKGALGILSGISMENLQFAVLAGDTKTIAKIPGIGPKTAGKLILELRDKFRLEDAFEEKDAQVQAAADNPTGGVRGEAAQALVALGYSMTEAMRVLREVEITETTTVEELLKKGLKRL